MGSTIDYVVCGMGDATWILFLGRIVDALSAGNIRVIYACVADVIPPGEPSPVFGILGAVGGAGFMLGPVIGGLLGQESPSAPPFAVAALTIANILWVVIAVPESLAPTQRNGLKRWQELNPLGQFFYAFGF